MLVHRRSKLKVTSSINLDADWSIIPRLRDAIIMHSVSKYKQTSMVYLQSSSSSSRTRVMNHNWSATKPSVAEISHYSVFFRGQDSTMWDIVWVSPQGHRSVSVSRISFCRHRAPEPCKNGSVEITVAEGGQNSVAGLWGLTLGENWPPEPSSSYVS